MSWTSAGVSPRDCRLTSVATPRSSRRISANPSSRPPLASVARPLLAVNEVEAYYGRVCALHSVSLQVGEGSVVALLGANGAGKTTTLRVISGLLRPTRGSVGIDGRPLGARRDRSGARGTTDLRGPHGAGEPVARWVRQTADRPHAPRPIARVRLFPTPWRAAAAARRNAERRRAADARHRTGADGTATPASAR